MPGWQEIEKVKSPMIRQLNAWWVSKRGLRSLPDRADVDPSDLKPLLPNILLADCTVDPFRIRYRLLGDNVVHVSGFNFAGRYLDELQAPDSTEPWLEHYRLAFNTQLPVYGDTMVPTIHGTQFTYEFGIFPLTHGGTDVGQFIALEDYGEITPRAKSFIDNLAPWKE